jgi:hypothetical protein
MRPHLRSLGAVTVVLAVVASCGEGPSRTAPSTSSPPSRSTTTTLTTSVEPLVALATVNPDQGVAGTSLTFSVAIKGRGTLSGEEVCFRDGQTSGANAGEISCGEMTRVDRTSMYTHAYTQPGTFVFSNVVSALGPPPSCVHQQVKASLTVIVAAPLSSATLNGAFLSPTKNIACYIDATNTDTVRCATFVPPRFVTMGPSGSFRTCTGPTCELGNPAQETPVLAYGSATGAGAFQCLSTPFGMTCTVVGHRGFSISRSGIRSVA